MSHVTRSSTAAVIQAARVKAREEILLRLLREPASGAVLRADLATRCGGAGAVNAAREWLRQNGLIRLAGTTNNAPMELTDAGRARALEVRDRRAAEREARNVA